ncbi:MAG: spore coat protein YlbD [Faecalibacillus sp.]
MDNMNDFKAFLKTIPGIKKDVIAKKYTWQQIYEIYTMYGEDDDFFRPYKTHQIDMNDILDIIKNVDLDTLSTSLQSIEKILNIVSTLISKNKDEKWS